MNIELTKSRIRDGLSVHKGEFVAILEHLGIDLDTEEKVALAAFIHVDAGSAAGHLVTGDASDIEVPHVLSRLYRRASARLSTDRYIVLKPHRQQYALIDRFQKMDHNGRTMYCRFAPVVESNDRWFELGGKIQHDLVIPEPDVESHFPVLVGTSGEDFSYSHRGKAA